MYIKLSSYYIIKNQPEISTFFKLNLSKAKNYGMGKKQMGTFRICK